ncbi:hypothetical protein CAOG_01523 [Capsaspora owczarzaki ATCC 30864]|nr:hypothetical protein CAOG_01523 [Capsaspora owczarzaki ATCC 30864]|eukprot:XP_004364391.2 hypothetical protein CAOG_01523 [Capsaspora owczarzaki ATCC 30864]
MDVDDQDSLSELTLRAKWLVEIEQHVARFLPLPTTTTTTTATTTTMTHTSTGATGLAADIAATIERLVLGANHSHATATAAALVARPPFVSLRRLCEMAASYGLPTCGSLLAGQPTDGPPSHSSARISLSQSSQSQASFSQQTFDDFSQMLEVDRTLASAPLDGANPFQMAPVVVGYLSTCGFPGASQQQPLEQTGALYLSDGSACIPIEVVPDCVSDSVIDTIVIVPSWNLIPSENFPLRLTTDPSRVSLAYLEAKSVIEAVQPKHNSSSFDYSQLSVLSVSRAARLLSKKDLHGQMLHVGGVVSALSPVHKLPGRPGFFMMQLSTDSPTGLMHPPNEEATVVFQGDNLLYYHNLLRIRRPCVLTNLVCAVMFRGQPNERRILAATAAKPLSSASDIHNDNGTRIASVSLLELAQLVDPNDLAEPPDVSVPSPRACSLPSASPSAKKAGVLISYRGIITKVVDAAVGMYELDQCTLLLTGLQPNPHFGRGLRVGASICVHNAHIALEGSVRTGFALCTFGSIEICSFSRLRAPYEPFVAQLSPYCRQLKRCTVSDFLWILRTARQFQAKIPPSLLPLSAFLGSPPSSASTGALLRDAEAPMKLESGKAIVEQLIEMQHWTTLGARDIYAEFCTGKLQHSCPAWAPSNGTGVFPTFPSIFGLSQLLPDSTQENASGALDWWSCRIINHSECGQGNAVLVGALTASTSALGEAACPAGGEASGAAAASLGCGELWFADATGCLPALLKGAVQPEHIGGVWAISDYRLVIETFQPDSIASTTTAGVVRRHALDADVASLPLHFRYIEFSLADATRLGQLQEPPRLSIDHSNRTSTEMVILVKLRRLPLAQHDHLVIDAQCIELFSSSDLDVNLTPGRPLKLSLDGFEVLASRHLFTPGSLVYLGGAHWSSDGATLHLSTTSVVKSYQLDQVSPDRLELSQKLVTECRAELERQLEPLNRILSSQHVKRAKSETSDVVVSFDAVLIHRDARQNTGYRTHPVFRTNAIVLKVIDRSYVAATTLASPPPRALAIYLDPHRYNYPLGLVPGAILRLRHWTLKISTTTGNVYCTAGPDSDLTVASFLPGPLPFVIRSGLVVANSGMDNDEGNGQPRGTASVPATLHLPGEMAAAFDLRTVAAGAGLSDTFGPHHTHACDASLASISQSAASVVRVRCTLVSINAVQLKWICAACEQTIVGDGSCPSRCPGATKTFSASATCIIDDGTAEATLFVYDQLVLTLLRASSPVISALHRICMSVGWIRFVPSAFLPTATDDNDNTDGMPDGSFHPGFLGDGHAAGSPTGNDDDEAEPNQQTEFFRGDSDGHAFLHSLVTAATVSRQLVLIARQYSPSRLLRGSAALVAPLGQETRTILLNGSYFPTMIQPRISVRALELADVATNSEARRLLRVLQSGKEGADAR